MTCAVSSATDAATCGCFGATPLLLVVQQLVRVITCSLYEERVRIVPHVQPPCRRENDYHHLINIGHLISQVPGCFADQLPLPVLGEAVAGGDDGHVVRADDVQVQGSEVTLLATGQLQLGKD